MQYQISHYLTSAGVDIYQKEFDKLNDNIAKVNILRRIDRLKNANFGDYKVCRDGIFELRIDLGQGYRIYFTIIGQEVVLLLCLGSKKSQDSDIARAIKYKQDYLKN